MCEYWHKSRQLPNQHTDRSAYNFGCLSTSEQVTMGTPTQDSRNLGLELPAHVNNSNKFTHLNLQAPGYVYAWSCRELHGQTMREKAPWLSWGRFKSCCSRREAGPSRVIDWMRALFTPERSTRMTVRTDVE